MRFPSQNNRFRRRRDYLSQPDRSVLRAATASLPSMEAPETTTIPSTTIGEM